METPVHYSHLPAPVMPRVPAQHLLLGQKALVTGASSGIGRSIALSLRVAGLLPRERQSTGSSH